MFGKKPAPATTKATAAPQKMSSVDMKDYTESNQHVAPAPAYDMTNLSAQLEAAEHATSVRINPNTNIQGAQVVGDSKENGEPTSSTPTTVTTEPVKPVDESKYEDDDEDIAPFTPPRKYRIALFAWESLHSVAVGGVAPHLTELAAGLERRGHEVHAYVRSGHAGQKHYELIDGVHIHRITFELDADFVKECENMCNAMVGAMCETERFMNAAFDIVHAHDWLAAQALINIKRNIGRNCVFTVHSTEYGRCGNNNYGGQSSRIRYIEAEAIGLADRVIGVSGVLCDEVKEQFDFDWNKIRCVYNGINCIKYDGNLWDPAQIRAQHGVGPMDPMVLFVGRMATQKGPDILVDAIPAILSARPDAKFVLVGDGYMKEDLYNRCVAKGVIDSVRFTGSMSGQPLVDLFKACDVVAIPSRNEPFGIVTLEAWAACKPVVVTKSGGPREFVWHDNDGYLVDTKPEGMAWGITQCFMYFDHAKYMGSRGRVKAAYAFSWDRIAECTNNVYDELFGIYPPQPVPPAEEQPQKTETTA